MDNLGDLSDPRPEDLWCFMVGTPRLSRSRCEFHPVLGMEVSNQVLISRPGMPRTPD